MSEILGKSWIEISRSALRENFVALNKRSNPSEVMCVVKADAYGHGLAEVGTILKDLGATWLAVDSLEEGRLLRLCVDYGPKILVLGFLPHDGWKRALRNQLSVVIFNLEQLQALDSALQSTGENRLAKLHLPIETGLCREGFCQTELIEILNEIKRLQVKYPGRVEIEGVQMHFANVEDTSDRTYADLQLSRFGDALSCLRERGLVSVYKHAASSAASILYSNARFDLVRPGLALYGLWPSDKTRLALERAGDSFGLVPVLSWKALIAQVKAVAKDEPVGYGLSERVLRDSKIAIIPVGYFDGYDRGLSGRGQVLIRGRRCKVLGRICMNMFMVDVTDVQGASVEDEVVLIGSQGSDTLSVDELAALADTISYEFVSRLSDHLPRIVVD